MGYKHYGGKMSEQGTLTNDGDDNGLYWAAYGGDIGNVKNSCFKRG
jgi:hypothetical protein